MTDTFEQKIIEDILGDVFTKQIVAELGISGDTAETQAELISMIGQNILECVMLEIFKIVPKDKHDELEAFIGSGDLLGFRNFLLPYIPDLDRFIWNEATKEYEATKTRAHEIRQGV